MCMCVVCVGWSIAMWYIAIILWTIHFYWVFYPGASLHIVIIIMYTLHTPSCIYTCTIYFPPIHNHVCVTPEKKCATLSCSVSRHACMYKVRCKISFIISVCCIVPKMYYVVCVSFTFCSQWSSGCGAHYFLRCPLRHYTQCGVCMHLVLLHDRCSWDTFQHCDNMSKIHVQCSTLREYIMHFFIQCGFSQPYCKLNTHTIYHHDPQSLLVNLIILIIKHMTVT